MRAYFKCCLREGLIDVVRPDIAHWGISGARQVATLAEAYYVAIAPHHDGGPVATAAALHLAASVPNFFIQHVPLPADPKDREMRAAIVSGGLETPRDGFLATSNRAGSRHSGERSSTGEISCGVDHFWHSAAPVWRSRKVAGSGGRLLSIAAVDSLLSPAGARGRRRSPGSSRCNPV